jgi:hypothetical protein
MDDLALRLAALDPEAGTALRVIAHFDSLQESRAGLQSIVRAAAALTGHPARLTDPARGLAVRILADGAAAGPTGDPDPAWPWARVTSDGAALWLECRAPADPVEAMVLERAAGAARVVLERTRARSAGDDPALMELVLDGTAPEQDRLAAARRLGLPSPARAVAVADGGARVVASGAVLPEQLRAGVGPAVAVADLPASWAAARLALRLTAQGSEDDPGPRVVHADELGALTLLIHLSDTADEPVPDVRALQHAASGAPWVLATLDAIAGASSLRDAARVLHLHHSTLQDRLAHAETLLGWHVRSPQGLLRLQLALVLRRAAGAPFRT